MYLNDIYTVSANLAGVPAISVPCGLSSDGLPIGLQLIGNFWSEGLLLNLANVYETAFPLEKTPAIYAG
jgi:aspartyl-tRNA(Asn)/glutamyl-tRNA(Gln) amidotransferase subunit A